MCRFRPLALAAAGLATAVIASTGASARVGPGHRASWGKAEVSLEQYWIDSAECGHIAAATDLEGTAPADTLVYASRLLENPHSIGSSMEATRMAAPEVQWQRAATILQRALESCLTERGYVKFKLTDDQARRLGKLEKGSLERRRFLHRLASDPDVLASQAIEADA